MGRGSIPDDHIWSRKGGGVGQMITLDHRGGGGRYPLKSIIFKTFNQWEGKILFRQSIVDNLIYAQALKSGLLWPEHPLRLYTHIEF